jgi:uncharacterized protein (TIGR02466 family)
MELITVFPTTIGKFKLDRNISDDEMSVAYEEEKESSKNIENYIGNNGYVLENSRLSSLKSFFEKSLNDFFYKLHGEYDDSVSLYITQSWFTYTKMNQSHHHHIHQNSILSGVFYFNADINYDSICMYTNNFLQNDHIYIRPKMINEYNRERVIIPVETGTLCLFNSKMPHDVAPVQTDTTRISLAFNSFVRGKIGDYKERTELILGRN